MTEMSELEREIEESRARLDRTIDRIQDRLSVSGVADDLMGQARRSGYSASLDRAAAALRDNPVPVLLVAAGIGWLAYSMTEAARKRDLRREARRDLEARGVLPRPGVRHVSGSHVSGSQVSGARTDRDLRGAKVYGRTGDAGETLRDVDIDPTLGARPTDTSATAGAPVAPRTPERPEPYSSSSSYAAGTTGTRR